MLATYILYAGSYVSLDIVLSYDIATLSDITPCIKIDTPLVVGIFFGNVMK